MGNKREIPYILKTVMDFDSSFTFNLVNFIDQHYGPLRKYYTILKGLEISCQGLIWLFGTAALYFLFGNFTFRLVLINIFGALIFDIIIVACVKAFTRRRRPPWNKNDDMIIISVDKFSFPSGHASRAVMFACLVMMSDLNILLKFIVLSWGTCVSASRILLKRHYVLDVLGGSFIGLLEAAAVNMFWINSDSYLTSLFVDDVSYE